METICSFLFCLMLFFTCSSIPNTCSCSKCSEAFYAELSGTRAILGVQTVPLEPVSSLNPNITTGCGSPLPRHSQHTAHRVLQHAGNTPPGPDMRQEARCTPALPEGYFVVQGSPAWEGRTISGGLSEGSSTANSKLPKRQLLQTLCKWLLH